MEIAKTHPQVSVNTWETLNISVKNAFYDSLICIAEPGALWREFDSLCLYYFLVSVQIGRVKLEELFKRIHSLFRVAKSFVKTASIVLHGDLVHNLVLVLLQISKSLGILALRLDRSDSKENYLALLMCKETSLRARLLLELEQTLNGLNAASVVAINEASDGVLRPVGQDSRLKHQDLTASLFEARVVTKVHLELEKFAQSVLTVRVALKSKDVGPSCLLILSTIQKLV